MRSRVSVRPFHAFKDCRNQQEFERAAHREPLIRAVRRTLPAGRIQNGHTKAAAIGSLELRES